MSQQNRNKPEWKSKMILSALLALAIFINSTACASALGITPGRKTIDFQPGIEETGAFTINNNEHKQFNAYIYAEGELANYISFEKNLVRFNESDNSKDFQYRVKLPERIDTPGDHWAKIVIMELPYGWEAPEGESRLIAAVGVIHQLRVKVPYPGKYMQLDLSVQEAAPNESVKFYVKLHNLGKEDIAKAQATIEIRGPTNEVIAAMETESKSLKSMQSGELLTVWNANVNPGMYNVKATVRYDGETGHAEKNFYVGNMLIDVLDITVKDFELGGIAKFDIHAESKWNQPISAVYAQMIINDLKENKVADFKSSSVDVGPFERAHIYAYWDTEGVDEGEYVSKLILHYAERTTEREIKTYVSLDAIRTEIVGGVSGGVVTAQGAAEQSPILILAAILIAVNMGWFIYFIRRKR